VNHWIVAPLLLPLLAGMASLLAARAPLRVQRTLGLTATAALLPLALLLLLEADGGRHLVYRLGDWPAPFGIVLVLDRLSALMVLLTAAIALAALVDACRGADRLGRNFHPLFQLQLLGLNGAFLTGDLFNLFVFFEILLIASYGLAVHGAGAGRVRAGLHYVALNLAGSALFLVAIGLLYALTGTLNLADLALRVAAAGPAEGPLLRSAALLLLVVFGLKAAILPLHLWLPALYGTTAAPVAALFAIMTKVGLYAILRVFTLVFGPDAGVAAEAAGSWLLPLALITLAAGAVGLLGSRDLRALVAWLVVISVGTLLAGIALANTAGLAAALYYLPHTTLVTAGLFLLMEGLTLQRRHGDQDGGSLAPAPLPAQPLLLGILFFTGAMAAAGLPPLSGFLGKLLLLAAAPPGPQAAALWGVVLVGGLATLMALSQAGSRIFWGTNGGRATGPRLGPAALLPMGALLGSSLLLVLLAAPVIDYAHATARQLLAPGGYVRAVLDTEAGR
jgi:multicomponent K+:H+ antiporter subunit D